jgi:hypothetical protein
VARSMIGVLRPLILAAAPALVELAEEAAGQVIYNPAHQDGICVGLTKLIDIVGRWKEVNSERFTTNRSVS